MLVGLVGFAGSGKGAVGDILVDRYQFTKLSFADALKDATSAIFGWSRPLLEGDTDTSREFREKKDDFWSAQFGYEVTPRKMLQLMGTEAGRNIFHNDIWVHTVRRRMLHQQEFESKERFVIPDVRFPNEIEAIRKWGGSIVRIIRGNEPDWFDMAATANSATSTHAPQASHFMEKLGVHYSEWAWIGQQFNYQINNNSTLIMLEADISPMIKLFTSPVNSAIIKAV